MDAAPGPATLSVLMPVHNEEPTLREIVRRVLDAPIDLRMELIIVDDGSTDGSREIIEDLAASDERITALRHARALGKGSAVRAAIARATGDFCIVQDADLEYDPADYPAVLAPLIEGRADAVFGSRFLHDRDEDLASRTHRFANELVTLLCNIASGLSLTDMETCYKAVRTDLLKDLPLTSRHFEFEVEVTIRLARRGATIIEVPIGYEGRTRAEGKKIGPADGLHAGWAMIKFGLFDRR
ncbi:MAG: glycosyltransferase family 2 protein [Planctomycetota bacterium]